MLRCRRTAPPSITTTSISPTCASIKPLFSSTLFSSSRSIVLPNQVKAYGDHFAPSSKQRRDYLVAHQDLLKVQRIANKIARPVDTFEDMLLPTQVNNALSELQVSVPSPIQQLAIPSILNSQIKLHPQSSSLSSSSSFSSSATATSAAAVNTTKNKKKTLILAAPQGTGKTIAYLAPLFASLVKDRDVFKIPLREHRPRAIIFAPTRELIWQIRNVCRTFEKHTGLKSLAFSSTKRNHRKWRLMMKNTMPDILIMGPSFALRAVEHRRLFLDDLRHVVLDEADELVAPTSSRLGPRFLAKVLKRLCYKHLWQTDTQSIFVTSGMTKDLTGYVRRRHGDAVPAVVAPELHLPAFSSQHRFIKVSKEEHKLDDLRRILMRGGWRPSSSSSSSGFSNDNIDEMPQVEDSRQASQKADEHQQLLSPSSSSSSSSSSLVHNNPASASSASSLTRRELKQQLRVRQQLRPVIRWENQSTTPAPFHCPFAVRKTSSNNNKNNNNNDDHNNNSSSSSSSSSSCSATETTTPGALNRKVIIFFKNIDRCTALYYRLRSLGFDTALMHGSLPTHVREENFKNFASGKVRILCATDLCARGLDVEDVSCVVNFDMASDVQTYLNRSGRTARMGRPGTIVSLFTPKQRVIVSAIRLFLKRRMPLDGGVHSWAVQMTKPSYAQFREQRKAKMAKRYVSLITSRTIPFHLEKVYTKHTATWRPIWHPQTAHIHGGVPVRQNEKVTARIRDHAVWYRRIQLAHRKGGGAKFGSARGRWMKGGKNPSGIVSGGHGASADPQHQFAGSNQYNKQTVGLPGAPSF